MKARRVKHLDPSGALADNAERLVRVRLDELCGFAPAVLDPAAVTELHDMRIAAKRLRYVLEVMSEPCFGPYAKTAGKRAKELQDLLGEIHDCDVQLPRVEALVAQLRDADADELRLRAGDAPDLDPSLAAKLPHADAWRGLLALEAYLRARRNLLYDRFRSFWRDLEREGFRARLEYAIAERPEPAPEQRPHVTLAVAPRVPARARRRPARPEHGLRSARGPRRPGRPGARRRARVNQPPLSEAEAARFLPSAEDPFPAPRESLDLADADLSFNREVSWADFNDRVLQLAEDDAQPLLERAKFAAIFTSNLDEFFMIRVAGLHDQVEAGITEKRRAGLNPSQTIDALRARIQPQMERQARMVDERLRPALAEHGIRIIGLDEVPEDQRPALGERFKRQVLPVLTPLAVGLGRPFPYISNLSLSLAVLVRDPETDQTVFARVKVPKEMLPRFVPVVEGGFTFVLLEDLIADNLSALFPGMEILDHGLFRVTRDADFEISDEADDLLEAVEAELRRRPFGEVVRLEVQTGLSAAIREQLVEALRVEERQVYVIPGLLDMNDLWQIAGLPGHRELRDEPWTPVTAPRAVAEADEHDMFSVIRQGDLLVHHPYESFATSVERFVTQAVEDPDVLAVKQTVYRTSADTIRIRRRTRARYLFIKPLRSRSTIRNMRLTCLR